MFDIHQFRHIALNNVNVNYLDFTLMIIYMITTLSYLVYNVSVKFRFRPAYNAKNEHLYSKFLFISGLILSAFGISFIFIVVDFVDFKEFNFVDWINIASVVFLIILSKFISNSVDHLPGMSDVIRLKEPMNYSLSRQFASVGPLVMIPLVVISGENNISTLEYYFFLFFSICMLITEAWERLIPLRLSYKKIKLNGRFNSNNLQQLFDNHQRNFWFREISGSVLKSTVNCWSCFVIIVLIIGKQDLNSFDYEGDPIMMDISTSFYLVANEMFFGGSGIFPNSDWAKVTYFIMHAYGLFLYGVFFAFGLQIYARDQNS